MKTAFLLVLCLAFTGCLSATAPDPGRTWFVSTSGHDENPGTAHEPFRTIGRAAGAAGPGDTVRVAAGTYAEEVVFPRSGKPGAPIVFEGERGPGGEWLTVLDRSVPATGWEPVPEVGAGVYKAELGFMPATITLDGRMLARVNDSHMETGTGFTLLAMPAEAPVQGNPDVPGPLQYGRHIVEGHLFWDGIEALHGYREGTTYIRFRAGDDPNGRQLLAVASSAPFRNWPRPGEGGGFTVENRSHLVVRDFCVRAAQVSFHLHGPGATDNVIERNLLLHGRMRVLINGGASRNVVRDNEMTLGYYGHDRPGAWGGSEPDRASSLACYVYRVFKFLVGRASSDDRAVAVRDGADNEISGNRIHSGLIGISAADATRLRVSRNEISRMSSIGLHIVPAAGRAPVDAEFHDNLVYDCNINLRLHHFNAAAPGGWRTYFYRNIFLQPEGRGSHIYVHWAGDDGPGVMADRDHPEVYLYHNTFSGGNSGFVPGRVRPGGGLRRVRMVNNIFSCRTPVHGAGFWNAGREVMDVFDHNWLGGSLPEGEAAWFGENNIVEAGELIVFEEGFQLPGKSRSRGAGLDLARPFSVQGRDFPALPGMEPGYFRGEAPDIGAVQAGDGSAFCIPEIPAD